jgi:hypothetical protein
MAAQFNYFGCSYTDILLAYKDSILSDYATAGISGNLAIENELEMQEMEVVNHLPSSVLSQLNEIDGMVLRVNASNQVTLPILPDSSFAVSVYYVGNLSDLRGRGCKSYDDVSETSICPNSDCWEDNLTALNFSISGAVISVSGASPGEDISVSYTVDKTQLEIPELKKLVRDLTCCVLGSWLYSREENEWKLVTRFCEKGDEGLDMLEDGYIPSVLKSQRWLTDPFPSRRGVTSVKVYRG